MANEEIYDVWEVINNRNNEYCGTVFTYNTEDLDIEKEELFRKVDNIFKILPESYTLVLTSGPNKNANIQIRRFSINKTYKDAYSSEALKDFKIIKVDELNLRAFCRGKLFLSTNDFNNLTRFITFKNFDKFKAYIKKTSIFHCKDRRGSYQTKPLLDKILKLYKEFKDCLLFTNNVIKFGDEI